MIIFDKAVASQWHAPILPAAGAFGNFFSVGTNSRYGHFISFCLIDYMAFSVLVGGPYLIRSASVDGNTLALVKSFLLTCG